MNTNDTIARHLQGDAVVTDVGSIRDAVERCGADNVLCVVTTTSCFAPRLPDKVAYKKPDTMLFAAYVVVAWWPGSLVAWWLGCHFSSLYALLGDITSLKSKAMH